MGCFQEGIGHPKSTKLTPSAKFTLSSIVHQLKISKKSSTTQQSILSSSNEEEAMSITQFKISEKILGIGGFGVVQIATRLCGTDRNVSYALKTLHKASVVQRHTGHVSVITELKTLSLVKGCKFICNMHYAFQDDYSLYVSCSIPSQ